MCLVSFIPLPDGYILSSNRDELTSRAAVMLANESAGENSITFPADIKGGSWIIMSNLKRVICILNGAFKNHKRHLPYRLSRGIMMKQFFEYSAAVDFFEQFNFDGIEPFTMVIIEETNLYEFRWDANSKYIKTLEPKNIHVWSSCTLYDEEEQQKRSDMLLQQLEKIDLNNHIQLKQIHILKDGPNDGLFIQRTDGVETVSHTQVIKSAESIQMNHYDLLQNRVLKSQY